MVSSMPKPKKGFSMSLGKPKPSSSSSSAAAAGTVTKSRGHHGRPGSGGSKPSPAIGVVHDEDSEDDSDGGGAGRGGKRDFVTGIGEGKVVTKEVVVERGPRVIALASNPWTKDRSSNGDTGPTPAPAPAPAAAAASTSKIVGASAVAAADDPAQEKSLDQLAAEAIARESRRVDDDRPSDDYGLGLDSDRVIGMVGRGGGEGGEEVGGGGRGGTGTAGKRRTGILEQNMIPGLMDVDGEDAKFRHDLGHRAEDLSARSKAYVDVPVAEFGAALLRGMGWNGPEGDVGGGARSGAGAGLSNEIEPRHHRLGLGAQPKPPEEMGKPRKRKPGEKARASDAERLKIWEQKVQEERARSQQQQQSSSARHLSVMDVVELAEDGGYRRGGGEGRTGRPRAMVLKTQGVPGLNKISVRMEDTGEKVLVDKSSVTRVSEDELARRPFSNNRSTDGRERHDENGHQGDSRGGGRRGGRAWNGGTKRSRSRSSDRDSGTRERDKDYESEGRGESKKAKSSKKDKKKHKKSSAGTSGSKRERERGGERRSDERGLSPSPSRSPRRLSRDEGAGGRGDRGTDRRRSGREDRSDGSRGGSRSNRDEKDSRRHNHHQNDARDGSTNGEGGEREQSSQRRSASEPRAWLRANIRVRVVHKSYAGGRAYLGKGKVVDVPRVGQATVRMDVGELVLEGVRERHLETVLPARGGKVIVVRGPEKGATGKLLAKNKESETALVQVYEDLRAITLSLDDVAEFTGMLDEDMDDMGY